MILVRLIASVLGVLSAGAARAQDRAAPGQIGDSVFTVQGIVLILGLVVSVTTLLWGFRKMRRENEADAQLREDRIKSDGREREERANGSQRSLMAEISKHNDSVEKRLNVLETKAADFMPRVEIEGKIEHEKNNRLTAQNALSSQGERNAGSIVEIKVSVGKLEQKQDSLVTDMGEIKMLLKEQSRDIAARMEKIQDCVTTISRKVG